MLKKSGIIAVILIVAGFIFSGFVLRSNYAVPILMYHSVNPVKNPYIRSLIVSPESFRRQMRFLKERRYNVVTLKQLGELIASGGKIPPRTIAITFDDGYRDNYTYAFPVLKEYKIPATIFIIIDEVGRLVKDKSGDDRLSWEEIRLMQDSGLINFGSHTMGPKLLTEIKSEEELKRQIFLSKSILEGELGVPVYAFSYPEGRFNAKIRQMVMDAGYKMAVATKLKKDYTKNDVFALRRVRVSPNSDNLFVFWFETSGFYNFLRRR
ncbi:MAG TPA: polysaccharide deacetylase family protein [Candidatus Margulisiibacteriota bacterium]|nr:polysaccharide deacetylase family protein [Candidatus Margulisiibacteriota bacterium]